MRRFLLLLVPLVLVGTTASPSRADDRRLPGIQDVAAELARKTREVLAGHKPSQSSVRLGLFVGSHQALDIGAGGGAFLEELNLVLNDFLDENAAFELSGKVFYVDDPDRPGVKVFMVKAQLSDKTGYEPAAFKDVVGYVRLNRDIARLAGPTVAFRPDAEYDKPPSRGQNEDIQKSIPPGRGRRPAITAYVKGSLIRARESSRYDVEILAGDSPDGTFRPLTATLGDPQFPGLPVVEIEKGQYYQVRVKNHDTVEVGLFLALDGVDQFAFSEDKRPDGRPQYKCWVVGPGEEIVIRGWHQNVDPGSVFGFQTTVVGQGAASRFPTLSVGKVGTIGLGVAYTKPPGSKGAGLETTTGAPIRVKQAAVKRMIAAPHEFVTVRYSR